MLRTVKILSMDFVLLFAAISLTNRIPIEQPEVNFQDLVRSGAVIIDVRTGKDYRKGHIHGAINIEMAKLRTERIQMDTSLVYITYCYMGVSSVEAVDILKGQGFNHVYNGGGINHLKKELRKK